MKRVHIAMPDEIYDLLKKQADEKSLSISSYVRLLVLEKKPK